MFATQLSFKENLFSNLVREAEAIAFWWAYIFVVGNKEGEGGPEVGKKW